MEAKDQVVEDKWARIPWSKLKWLKVGWPKLKRPKLKSQLNRVLKTNSTENKSKETFAMVAGISKFIPPTWKYGENRVQMTNNTYIRNRTCEFSRIDGFFT